MHHFRGVFKSGAALVEFYFRSSVPPQLRLYMVRDKFMLGARKHSPELFCRRYVAEVGGTLDRAVLHQRTERTGVLRCIRRAQR